MIELRTLGALEITGPLEPPAERVLAQPKRAAVLLYLALERPPGFRRKDLVLSLFWPDRDAASATRNLRQTLHFLRSELGSAIVRRR